MHLLPKPYVMFVSELTQTPALNGKVLYCQGASCMYSHATPALHTCMWHVAWVNSPCKVNTLHQPPHKKLYPTQTQPTYLSRQLASKQLWASPIRAINCQVQVFFQCNSSSTYMQGMMIVRASVNWFRWYCYHYRTPMYPWSSIGPSRHMYAL